MTLKKRIHILPKGKFWVHIIDPLLAILSCPENALSALFRHLIIFCSDETITWQKGWQEAEVSNVERNGMGRKVMKNQWKEEKSRRRVLTGKTETLVWMIVATSFCFK